MNKKEVEALARKAAKGLKTKADVTELSRAFRKVLIESMLDAEMDEHLGYARHEQSDFSNSRNGHSRKRLKTDDSEIKLKTLRGREGSFEPTIVKKHQTRTPAFDDKILSLYAKGMTTREITATLLELYDVEVSAGLISRATDSVLERVVEWQSPPTGCDLSDHLSGLYCSEDSARQPGD